MKNYNYYEAVVVNSEDEKEKEFSVKAMKIVDKVIFWIVYAFAVIAFVLLIGKGFEQIYEATEILDEIYNTDLFGMFEFTIAMSSAFYAVKFALLKLRKLLVEKTTK